MNDHKIALRNYRVEVMGILKLIAPCHIGTGERLSILTDDPLLRLPGDNAFFIPGTSLRGVIKSHLEREACLLGCNPEDVDNLFGQASEEKNNKDGFLGHITVQDAYPNFEYQSDNTYCNDSEIRDYVKINPEWGAAEHGAKYDSEVCLANAHPGFNLHLIYEGAGSSDREYLLFHEAVQFLKSGRMHVGGNANKGFGRIILQTEQLRYYEFNRLNDEGLSAYLNFRYSQKPPESISELSKPTPLPHSKPILKLLPWAYLEMRIAIHFDGPVLIKSSLPPLALNNNQLQTDFTPNDRSKYGAKGQLEADMVFIESADQNYYLPGSSLRGVLRHQSRRISKTIFDSDRNPLEIMNILFGCIKTSDSYGSKTLLEIEDGFLEDAANTKPQYFDLVAIDRIVGFAADGAKYSISALISPTFCSNISLRFNNLPEHKAAVALWAMVLRDIMEGKLSLGYGTSRGYGFIKNAFVNRISMNAPQDMGFIVPNQAEWENVFTSGRQISTYNLTSENHDRLDFSKLNWIWNWSEYEWQKQIERRRAM